MKNNPEKMSRKRSGLSAIAAMLVCVCGLVVMQLLVVGGLDRLGISPQLSFLAFNLALFTGIAGILGRRIFSLRLAALPIRSRLAAPAASSADLVCKILVIRRLNFLSDDMIACRNFSERTNANAIVARD